MISIDSFEGNGFNSNISLSVSLLKKLYEKSGNCSLSGYLGDSIESISVDSNGHLEFTSKKESDEVTFITDGTVLSDSIVIKQKQLLNDNELYLLYFWNSESNLYTFIQVDNEKSMNECYQRVKNGNINLFTGDISIRLNNMGLSYDNISQILLNKDIDSIYSLVNIDYGKSRIR